MKFRRGVEGLPKERKSGGVFEPGLLPDSEKERLCRSLLAEFGVTHIREGGPGELIHGCVLPFKDHRDQDRNPTASLNYQKLTYNCFGCGGSGGLLWFVGIMRDESGTAARRWLSEQTGIGGPEEQSLSSLLSYFDAVYDTKQRVDAPMPKMDVRVLDPWLKIHPYMTEERGVPEDTLMHFKVGYGVIKLRQKDDSFTQSHRIIIPHFWKGDLVGWQSRRLVKDGTPKYMASPDFPRERTIFNYQPDITSAVICESPLSVLSKFHLGPHIEATFGAQVTDRQIRLIARHRKVTLFMDNDDAGWTSTKHLGERLEAYSSVWVADNPYAADPADMDDDTYLGILNDAVPFALWAPPTELVPWGNEEEGDDGPT